MAYFDAPYRPADLTLNSDAINNDLVGFWPLTDGSGSSAVDVSTGGNSGTIVNGTYQVGDGGTELYLSGSSSAVDLGDLSLNTSTAFTVTAWIDGTYGSNNQIVCRDEYSVSRHWQFRTDTSSRLNLIRFNSGGGVVANFSGSTSLTDGERYFVAFTFDTINGSVIYLNGNVDGTNSSTNANNSGTGTEILIGAFQQNGFTTCMPAGFQNVRIFSSALTAAQVEQLYTRPWTGTNYDTEALWLSPPSSPTLSTASEATSIMTSCIGWWPLTEGSGSTATDLVGSNNGTLTSGITWANGSLGNASEHPSSASEYISTGLDLAGKSAVTVSAWIRNDGSNSGASYGKIVTQSHGGNFDSYISKASNTDLKFHINATTLAASQSDIPTRGDWFHVCFLWEQSLRQEFYINGKLSNSTTANSSVIGSTTHDVFIGGTSAATRPWDGGIQNVRIWDRALSASEVALLAERPFIGAEYNESFYLYPPVPSSLTPLDSSSINTDLQGWWPLTEEDNFASGATDISGNSYNLTKTGTVTSEFSALGTVPLFDGSTGYLRRAQDLSSHTSGVGTISLWWRLDSTAANNPGDVLFYMGDESTAYTMLVIAGRIGGSLASASISFLTYASGSPQNLLGVYDNGAAWAFDDTWHHFCYVVNSSSNHMYIDGVEISQSYYPGYGSSSTGNVFLYDATNFDAIRVGSRSASSATSAYTQGNVSNVRLWSRALSSTEVADIFYSPWLGSAYPSTGGGTPSYFVAAQFNRLGIGPRFRRL